MGPVPLSTLDLGNTRLKACRWRPSGAGWESSDAWSGSHRELDGFRVWLVRELPRAAALASVAGDQVTGAVWELLLAAGVQPSRPQPGLENRCREPARVGQDRLFAAVGAAELLGRSALVVDAGTALTVDALLVQGQSRAFLGGAIAPGPELAAAALASGTAGLPRIHPEPGASALGRDTEEALQAGVGVGFRGAAAALVEELARAAGIPEAPVVLAGGAREFLLAPRPFTARELHVVPDLVHRGLLAAHLRTAGGREVR